MKEHRGLLGYYNYTAILTYVGLLGFAGIACSVDGRSPSMRTAAFSSRAAITASAGSWATRPGRSALPAANV